MWYKICWIWFVLLGLALQAAPIEWDGIVYDDETVAKMITIITTTNPIPSIPSLKHIYPSQKSLFRIPAFTKCKKIIVFDGLQPGFEHRHNDYERYKQSIAQLCSTDPIFSNTKLVFCERWEHLAGAIRQAMLYVTTPYIFVHQHDFVLQKFFDLNGVIASMQRNPHIKHVKLCYARIMSDFAAGSTEEYVEGPSYVPLCRTFIWSDQDHVSRATYYNEFVLPYCHRCSMECVLDPLLGQTRSLLGDACHSLFGTYVYGTMQDGGYLMHSNGREN